MFLVLSASIAANSLSPMLEPGLFSFLFFWLRTRTKKTMVVVISYIPKIVSQTAKIPRSAVQARLGLKALALAWPKGAPALQNIRPRPWLL